MNETLTLPVQDRSQAGEARRTAAAWGRHRGWDEELAGRVALVVTELGNNLAIHTRGGSLLLRSLSQAGAHGVEILSLDSGPGVANFNDCLRDGFSTAGTSGTGLGAVKRASQVFASHSQLGVGTALLSEMWARLTDLPVNPRWFCGAINTPKRGEMACGDHWTELRPRPDRIRLMIADGLGHGEFAAQASLRAVETLHRHPGLELLALMERIHDALRPTRGAAVAIADVDLTASVITYTGIGNIAGSIFIHENSSNLVSLNGTVGGQKCSPRIFTYPWHRDATLVMGSDGLKSQWQLNRYSGLLERHPSLIAGVLYRDYCRGSDDTTVVALKSRA